MPEITPHYVTGCSREEINTVPTTAGIYIFYSGPEILYVGKSVNLRSRLIQHLENARTDAKEAAIISQCTRVECVITDSELNALLLEANLIKQFKPKYNARLKDDKSYLYIKVTVKDTYPKLFPVRREQDGKSRYFGPFPSIHSVEELLRELRKVFPFCTQKRITKTPCFYAKIDLCKPCPNVIEQEPDEQKKREMKRQYRRNIRMVMRVLDGNSELVLKDLYRELQVLTRAQKYEEAIALRNRIQRLEHLIHDPLFSADHDAHYNRSEESTKELVGILDEFYPELTEVRRMECYDISNFQQKDATASMVVFTGGLANKKEYKRFIIKNPALQSDFDMFEEVFTRRFKHDWDTPDLVVVDGGRPQVTRVREVFAKLGVKIPLIGIAKHPDRLVIGIDNLPTIKPPVQNLGFNMVRAIRDESHRFAKKYHVFLRDKKMKIG